MKTTQLLLAFSMALSCQTLFAQTATQKVKPFLAPADEPDGYAILPQPPQPFTPEYFNDYFYYGWGKQQRTNPQRADSASFDYFHSDYIGIAECLSDAFGMKIDKESTPQILTLLQKAIKNAKHLCDSTKDQFMRVRPFEQFKELSLIQERKEYDKEVGTYSHPSGHTLRMFTAAYLLAEINPTAITPIMRRALAYVENRLVCGHHYKSDIDAAIILAGTLVARLHADEGFARQMSKAKAEYRKACKDKE